jgi:hypothetical protein
MNDRRGAASRHTGITIEEPIHFARKAQGRKELRPGKAPVKVEPRVPRISRLLALAHRIEDLVQRGEIKDYAEVARLGHVTRARVTQIMNLLALAPDIQEDILHLPPNRKGFDAVSERTVRDMTQVVCWNRQRAMWREVSGRAAIPGDR